MDNLVTKELNSIILVANEHAKSINSLVVTNDEDLKIVKKERAKARKFIKRIQEKITENRNNALKIVEEENQVYIEAKNDIEKIYADFFEKVDNEINLKEKEKREAFNNRVKRVIDEQSFTIDYKKVPDEIYKACKDLKTDKKLIELLKEIQDKKDIIDKNIEKISEKAFSLELTPKRYINEYLETQDILTVLENMEREASEYNSYIIEKNEQIKKEKLDKEIEIENKSKELRDRIKVIEEKEIQLNELINTEQQKEQQRIKELALEKRVLEQENKNKILMEVVYYKTEENSKVLNELLSEMKKYAEVTLRKEV